MSKGILGGHDRAVKEFSAACLGDERRTKRPVEAAEAVAASPGKAPPEGCRWTYIAGREGDIFHAR